MFGELALQHVDLAAPANAAAAADGIEIHPETAGRFKDAKTFGEIAAFCLTV